MSKNSTLSKQADSKKRKGEGLLVQRLVRLHGLDRRFRYTVFDGMLCTHGKCTVPCSGCSCGGDYPCSCCATRGAGCDECGYTGKLVDHFPVPVVRDGIIIRTNKEIGSA